MRFKVLKSSFDGISGGESNYENIDDVLREISYHKGWDSIEQLRKSIKKWAKEARPGSVFSTQVTAIIAVGVDRLNRADDVCHHCGYEDGLDYGEMDGVEGGNIEQTTSCPECGERWVDVFVLAEQRSLCKQKGKK
jgi:hypothetical protein